MDTNRIYKSYTTDVALRGEWPDLESPDFPAAELDGLLTTAYYEELTPVSAVLVGGKPHLEFSSPLI